MGAGDLIGSYPPPDRSTLKSHEILIQALAIFGPWDTVSACKSTLSICFVCFRGTYKRPDALGRIRLLWR